MPCWTRIPIVLLVLALVPAACRSSSVDAGDAVPAMSKGVPSIPIARETFVAPAGCSPEKRALLLEAARVFDTDPERARRLLREVGNRYAHALLALRAWIDGDALAARVFLARTSAGAATGPTADSIASALRAELERMDCDERDANAVFDEFAVVPCALFRELPGEVVTEKFIGFMGSSRDRTAFLRKRACFESYLASHLDHEAAEAVRQALSKLRNDVTNVCRFQTGFCGTMFVSAMATSGENTAFDLFFDPNRNLPPSIEDARHRAETASSSLGARARLIRFERAVANQGSALGNALCSLVKARRNPVPPDRCQELGRRAAWAELADVLATYSWAVDEGVCSKAGNQPFCARTSE